MARSIDIPRRAAQVAFDKATMSDTTFRREHLCEFVRFWHAPPVLGHARKLKQSERQRIGAVMTPDNPPKYEFLKDGRVVLPSNADPAAYGTVVHGWLKHHVGMDLGRNDPSGNRGGEGHLLSAVHGPRVRARIGTPQMHRRPFKRRSSFTPTPTLPISWRSASTRFRTGPSPATQQASAHHSAAPWTMQGSSITPLS